MYLPMPLMASSRSRILRLAPFVAAFAGLALLCAHAHPQSSPAPSPSSPTAQIPIRAEIQPNLNVDRDPIPSPDPDVAPTVSSAPAANAPANAPLAPGEATKRQDGMYVLHANVDEVLLDCTVIDQKGQVVTDLHQRDFRVWEDGVPQTVNAFLLQDLPVSMGILVDNSGSMRDKRTAVNAAAMELLRASNPRDAAFVVNFSDHAYLDQGFTTDRIALDKSLSRYDSRGTTAMYDAVVASADELSRHAKERKQVLLIITDGADNASRLTMQQAIRRVQDLGGPVVYTIGLLFDSDKDEADRAHTDLERLSQETGGIAYFPRSLDEVNTIAEEIARDIRNQYTIAYRSTRPSSYGGYRVVHVEAAAPGHSKLTVITRHGYYANPKTAPQPAQTAQKTTP
jgi:Ca-activated chloride channel family protein